LISATITNLQSRLDATVTSNTLMKEELTLTKSALEKAQEELTTLQSNSKKDGDRSESQEKGLELSPKSDTYIASEDAIAEIKIQLAEEKNRRLDIDKELELQSSMRAETEVALKLLEKDVHEKQDTIISLRKQLEDIKMINLEMYRKLQECDQELRDKGEMVGRLQAKTTHISNILANLEQYPIANPASSKTADQ